MMPILSLPSRKPLHDATVACCCRGMRGGLHLRTRIKLASRFVQRPGPCTWYMTSNTYLQMRHGACTWYMTVKTVRGLYRLQQQRQRRRRYFQQRQRLRQPGQEHPIGIIISSNHLVNLEFQGSIALESLEKNHLQRTHWAL